jgi:hypothetical protein
MSIDRTKPITWLQGGVYASADVGRPSAAIIPLRRSFIFVELNAERERQEAAWGTAHDDRHDQREWEHLAKTRINMAYAERTLPVPGEGEGSADRNWRKRMLQAAAVAIAAVESFDRQHPTDERTPA